jgi:hypothetical protein
MIGEKHNFFINLPVFFSSFREYALRRIKDGFQSNKTLTDFGVINDQVSYAVKNLGIIRRQVIYLLME